MANVLPILLLGGGALLLLGRKKKPTPAEVERPPSPDETKGPPGAAAGTKTWKGRQTALTYLGYGDIVGKVDGKYGKNTKKAIRQFQKDYGIGVDGKWGPQTQGAVNEAIAKGWYRPGFVKKKKPTKKRPTEWGDHYSRCEVTVTGGDHPDKPHYKGLTSDDYERLSSDIKARKTGDIEYEIEPVRGIILKHTHLITLTTEQRRRLSQGKDVFVSSTEARDPIFTSVGVPGSEPMQMDIHTHQVQLRCSK